MLNPEILSRGNRAVIIQKNIILASKIVEAACQVLREIYHDNNIDRNLIIKNSYFFVKKRLDQMDQTDSNKSCDNKNTYEMLLADDLAFYIFREVLTKEPIENPSTPEMIRHFRQAILSVLKSSTSEGYFTKDIKKESVIES